MPPAFGIANYITAARAALVGAAIMKIGKSPSLESVWSLVGMAITVTVLDGVDGWAARRFGQASAFGARFDMEVDALLIMALSVLAWTWDKAGAWVLLSGLLRYLFVGAGWMWPWM